MGHIAPIISDHGLGRGQDALVDLANGAKNELARITQFWCGKIPDPKAGFFGAMAQSGQIDATADRALILNTRLLWFYAAAGRATGDKAATTQAHRAFETIKDGFVDKKSGGVVWMLDHQHQVKDRRKQAYGQAFAIYALCEYVALSANQEALKLAQDIFSLVEAYFYDDALGGWIEALGPDFEPIEDMRLSARDINAPKSMNTHLHILEAYSGLHKLAPNGETKLGLTRAIKIMAEKIYQPNTRSQALFFTNDWSIIPAPLSFGHDIEASWLLWEAAEILGEEAILAVVRPIALALANQVYEDGRGPNGETFEEVHANGSIETRRVWWIQAEAIVGFLNAAHLYAQAGEYAHAAKFEQAALDGWAFVQDHQIDRSGVGEWFASSDLDPKTNPPELMAGPWKCPYHTGRAMIEIMNRLVINP